MTAHLTYRRSAATLSLALGALIVASCAPGPEDAAVTTLDPPPGPFNGSLELTLTTDQPATIYLTTDGTDPRKDGDHVISGESPLTVTLDSSAVVSFYSVTPDKAEESLRSVQYVRAGGPKGTVTGAVVVGSLALGRPVALQVGSQLRPLGTLNDEGELPFELEDLPSGNHRFVAIADSDEDGRFSTLSDFTSDTVRVPLDLDDPFQASAENVRVYLGSSPPDLGTLTGSVYVPNATGAENLSISALSGNAFTGGADPAALLSQLTNGYRLFTADDEEVYPYVITDLEPGLYMPVPLLTSFSGAGVGLNFVANILSTISLAPGDIRQADFEFGPVELSGTVTLRTAPGEPPPGSNSDSGEGSNDGSGDGDKGDDEDGSGNGDENGDDGSKDPGGDDGNGSGGDDDDSDGNDDGGSGNGDGSGGDEGDDGSGNGNGGDSDGNDGDDPPGPDLPGFVYGVVAARHFALLSGSVQAVIMPVIFTPGNEGELRGRYLGRGLKRNTSFELRVFTSLDPENPATAALSWLVSFDIGGGGQTGITVRTDSNQVEYDFEIDL